MILSALIRRLHREKEKHHGDDVEFIIVRKSDGAIITMEMEGQAANVVKALKLFRGVDRGNAE